MIIKKLSKKKKYTKKKGYFIKIKKLKRIRRFIKKFKRRGRKYKTKTFSIKNRKFKKVLTLSIKNLAIDFNISIKILPNNIFCVLRDNLKNHTAVLISAGLVKIKISKKKLRFINRSVIENFLNKIKEKIKHKTCLVRIAGPKKIIGFVSKHIVKSLKKSTLLMNVLNKKIFNGCRAKKIRRKKRKGIRVFK